MVTRADKPELEHHGVKGQKWGVRRYKNARSKGVAAKSKIDDARDRESNAQDIYDRSGNAMYKSMSKRDRARDKASVSKSGSRKQARLTKKADKYNQKVKDYANLRNTAKNEVKNARSDNKKATRAYNDAVRKAAKEKVYIKDHTEAKHLLVTVINSVNKNLGERNGKDYGSLGLDDFKSSKDDFDEAVMAYRNKVR